MIELIFLKVLILISVKKHLENVVYVSSIISYGPYLCNGPFNYGPYLCNGCYDMSMKAVSMQNLTIINHNGNYYRVIYAFMTKKDAYNLIKNAIIMVEKGTL